MGTRQSKEKTDPLAFKMPSFIPSPLKSKEKEEGKEEEERGPVDPHTTPHPCSIDAIQQILALFPTGSGEDSYPIGTFAPSPIQSEALGKFDKFSDVLLFEDGVTAPVHLVGGKAKHLIELTSFLTSASSDLFHVPRGCVVTTQVYKKCVTDLHSLSFRPQLTERELQESHDLIQSIDLPDDIVTPIRQFASSFPPGTLFAVRSSATVEDAKDFSLAGLAESYLFVTPDEIPRKISMCWASLWTTLPFHDP